MLRRGSVGPASTSVESFLAQVRALLVRTGAQLAALYAIAALSTLAAVLPVLAWIFLPARTTSFAILGAAGLLATAVLVAAGVLGGIAVRRRFAPPAAVARWVGARASSIASDLLSTVQLAASAPPLGVAGGDDAPATARPREASPPSPADRSPWSPELAAALRTSTERRLADLRPHALLDRRWLSRALSVAAIAVTSHGAMWTLAPGKMMAGWRHLVVPRHLPYDASVLSSVPIVGDLDLTLRFPGYAKRPDLHLDSTAGDVSALAGTRIEITAHLLVEAAKVEIVVEHDDGSAEIAPAMATGEQVRSALSLTRSGRYRFAVTDAVGRRTLEASARSLEAQADSTPAVQLIAPADSLDVSNLRQVELAYVIEDDFGVAGADLVWESGSDHGKKAIALAEPGAQRSQGKILWDMSEMSLPPGADVRYWLEARDTDDVTGPNLGRSRELHLKVVSPRERHEQTLDRQEEIAEHMLAVLAGRLVVAADDLSERHALTEKTAEVVVELGTLAAAYERDAHASAALRKAIVGLRERLDKWRTAEARVLAPMRGKPGAKLPAGRLAATDARLIAELEDGVTLLADWMDRERLEGMLDIADEIAGHQRRLKDLLEQYARTADPRLRAEIERELRALDTATSQLANQRGAMPQDVLDQFVHNDAVDTTSQSSCTAEVRRLFLAGDSKGAAAKLAECGATLDRSTSSLEGSLDALRGDRFGEEQKKLDEVMNELADVARDQDDIAGEASRIFDEYAAKIDRLSEDNQREAAKKIASLLERLRRRLAAMPEAGLTPFAQEELDIVHRRLADLENMVDDGDLAEALAMAKQAKQSIDTIAGELDAALQDEPGSVFAADTERALEAAERARPVARELVEMLGELAPSPRDVLSADDKRALDVLRRRQMANRERGKRLSDRTRQLGDELPGEAGKEVSQRLQSALDQMAAAEGRMRALDPSGARQAARAAADALAEAQKRTKGAARQRQEGAGMGEEPVRIPGAEEYRAPEQFREDILEAMKKKAPSGYDDLVRRYYQELIR